MTGFFFFASTYSLRLGLSRVRQFWVAYGVIESTSTGATRRYWQDSHYTPAQEEAWNNFLAQETQLEILKKFHVSWEFSRNIKTFITSEKLPAIETSLKKIWQEFATKILRKFTISWEFPTLQKLIKNIEFLQSFWGRCQFIDLNSIESSITEMTLNTQATTFPTVLCATSDDCGAQQGFITYFLISESKKLFIRLRIASVCCGEEHQQKTFIECSNSKIMDFWRSVLDLMQIQESFVGYALPSGFKGCFKV